MASGTLVLSKGNFYNKAGLDFTLRGGMTFGGQGWDDVNGSIIHYHGSADGISTGTGNRITIEKLALLAAGSAAQVGPGTPTSLLRINQSSYCTIDRVYIDGRNPAYGNNADRGIWVEGTEGVGGSYYCIVRQCYVRQCTTNYHFETVGGDVDAQKCAEHTIEQCVSTLALGNGFRADAAWALTISGGEYSDSGLFGLSFSESAFCLLLNVWAGSNPSGNLQKTSNSHNIHELANPQLNLVGAYKDWGVRDGAMYMNDVANANDPTGVNSLRIGGQVVMRRYLIADAYCRLMAGDDNVGFKLVDSAGNVIAQFEEDAAVADTETALLVRRNVSDTITLERVTMGAGDSGGAGFKVLRVPN